MSKQEHWKMTVIDKESAFVHLRLYHPDKPEIVLRAYALKIAEIVKQSKEGTLSDEDVAFIQRHQNKVVGNGEETDDIVWDPIKEIEQAKLDGLTNLACKRLDALMKDADSEEEIAVKRNL